MPETINFYSTTGDHGCFSNFYRVSIFLKKKRWPTTEHYFQAQKFAGTEHEEEVRTAKTPSIAASLGRDRKKPLRKDWESVKETIMREALHAKFTQHEELKEILLSTGDAHLVEHTENDSYWGDGGDGSGKNRLGILLMELRTQLKEEN